MTGTDFASPTSIDPRVHQQGFGAVRYGNADDSMLVTFYEREIELGFQSSQAGRPVHETRIYVRMVPPGSNGKYELNREATEEDKRRFPRHWAAFENNRKDPGIIGTPLSSCTFIDRAKAADLWSVNIKTVEQLASLDDAALGRLGPGYRHLKAQAHTYLEDAAKQAPLARVTAELEDAKQQVQNLSATNAEMMRRLEVLERERLYSQPQPPPQHVQAQIEAEVNQAHPRPFFGDMQVPDAREAFKSHMPAPQPATETPAQRRRGRPSTKSAEH